MPQASASREAFWRELLARHASSNLSVDEICRKAAVSTASFYAWRRRLGSSSPPIERSALVPVRIVSDEVTPPTEGSAEAILIEVAPVPGAPALRISIPTGCDEESIRRVIQAILRSGGANR
jgi:hypothetical protein